MRHARLLPQLNPNITLCQDLTPEDCAAKLAGVLSPGKSCSDLNNTCPADGAAQGCGGGESCCIEHGDPGCSDVLCCSAVCEGDPFCCDSNWDDLCVADATNLCGDLCDACGNGLVTAAEECDDGNG